MEATKTHIFRIDRENFERTIKAAARIIRDGGTVAFPTETVYGLGADALNPAAVMKIFQAKARPADNPLIAHVSSRAQICELAEDVPACAFDLMDAFMPGPLTLILKRKAIVPDVTTGGLDTIAVRMPDHPVAIGLIRESGTPIAAPSANLSGRPSPTTAAHVAADLTGRIDAIIDGGQVRIGVESTVLDLTSQTPTILRPGGIGIEAIRGCMDEVNDAVDAGDAGDAGDASYMDAGGDVASAGIGVAKSPGMKYTHYAPETLVILVEGDPNSVATRISELIAEYHKKGSRVGIMMTKETAEQVSGDEDLVLCQRDDPEAYAHNLFGSMRYLDGMDVDVIIADGSIQSEGVGAAVLNRLRKAAGRR
ncbi:MAG: L-threonylcarbamoyladenylate synthase [Euryarchaeota archaeon]|nr:L-threonylcarbamoyladenylate synthase [Euryarchaeota archaeon]